MKRMSRKSLRKGYTTGACAAAAAKAAASALLMQVPVSDITITLPAGQPVSFGVSQCDFDIDRASCTVIKDAGDDPDVTDGIEIRATAVWMTKPGIRVVGGQGIGRVTKPGLDIAVGGWAINPVPEKMIMQSVEEILTQSPAGRGIELTIAAPGGEQLAKKTLNSRLGIIGGISIIGTSGIVIPYSAKAYTACISKSLDVASACGCETIVLSTGRRSEKYAQRELRLPDESFILAGDYIGYSLKNIARRGFDKAIIWGMIGKMSKLASGNLYTNVSDSLVDIAMMTGIARDCQLPEDVIDILSRSVTANHFRKLLPPEYVNVYCDRLSLAAAAKCSAGVAGKVSIECIITDPEGTILGRSGAQ